MYSTITTLVAAVSTLAAPISRENKLQPRTSYPFTKIVAFGDDFTDNGEGSYAHGITGNETTHAGAHLWGANTWTDGLVPISYLSETLGMTLTYDYAFGSEGGAQYIGSVCNNSVLSNDSLSGHAHLLNGNLVPDVLSQINNYTTKGKFKKGIKNTLHFLWTGQNDVVPGFDRTSRFEICSDPSACLASQKVFITQLINCMSASISNLIAAGAEHIIVPNIYPRQLAPWTALYITQDVATTANFANLINTYNTHLKALTASLAKSHNVDVIYYDVNAFVTASASKPAMVEGAAYNYTCVDGCPTQVPGGNFNTWYNNTILEHEPDDFYWMTTITPTTTVFRYLAADMLSALEAYYA